MEDFAKRERGKYYLDYIDKEMTFAGIITTINLGSLLFISERMFSTSSNFFPNLCTPYMFGFSVLLIVISAGLLIRHRSNLAFYYGQISLTMYSPTFTNRPLYHWFKIIDNWKFWSIYFWGMGFLYTGITLLGLTFLAAALHRSSQIWAFFNRFDFWVFVGIAVLAIAVRKITMIRMEKNDPNNPLAMLEELAQDIID